MLHSFATFRDPVSRRIKRVKVGPNWAMFFFSPFFGIPLFLNGFWKMGLAMLAVTFAGILAIISLIGYVYGIEIYYIDDEDELFLMGLICVIMLFYAGSMLLATVSCIFANKWIAEKYYKRGWRIIDASSDPEKVKKIKMAWSLPDNVFDDMFSGLRPLNNYPG